MYCNKNCTRLKNNKIKKMKGRLLMRIAKNVVNSGMIQGILLTDVVFPNEKVAMFNVKIKDSRENPETKKKQTYIISCTAFEKELVETLKGVVKGQLLFVRFHLTHSKSVDRKTGVTNLYDNRIADEIIPGEVLEGNQQVLIPYVNTGVCQGEFQEIFINKEDSAVAHVKMRVTHKGAGGRDYISILDFTAYGPVIKYISAYYETGDSICLIYKIETTKKAGRNIVDYVIQSLF